MANLEDHDFIVRSLSRTTSYDEAINLRYRSTDLDSASKSDRAKSNKSEDSKVGGPQPKVGVLQLYRCADKFDALLAIVGLISAVASGLSWPGMSLVFGAMIDSFLCYEITSYAPVISNLTSNSTALPCVLGSTGLQTCGNGTVDIQGEITTAAVQFTLIGIGVWVSYYLYVTLLIWTAERQTRKMREECFRSVLRQEIGWFDTNKTGEIATQMTEDLNKVYAGIGDKIGSFAMWMSTFIGSILIGFFLEWRLTLVILGITPFLAAVTTIEANLAIAFTTREQGAYARAGSVAEEVISCIRTVVAFGGEDKEAERYKAELEYAKAEGKKKSLSLGFVLSTAYFLFYCVYAITFWFSGYLVEKEGASSGDIIATFFAVLIGAFSLGLAAPNLEAVNIARGAAVRVFQILDKKSEIDPLSDEGEQPDEDLIKGNIEFKNIRFTYPARQDVEVLHNVSLEVNCGETVALVGPSGCGKSTLIQLLQRFYTPQEGTILLDGYDLKCLNVRWLRNHIGVVSQEPVLFATTIAENIRYGKEGVSHAEIETAAKQANAHDFIMKLPQKYNTLVGDRGAQLSGGQKQRVAIARALVRNPKILLLDEATSALDTESEKIVQSALERAAKGRTTIVVAHRLSTIQNATSITAIVKGQVVESGTHSQLMREGNVYYDLVMAQQVGDDTVESAKNQESSISSSLVRLSGSYQRSSAASSQHALQYFRMVSTGNESLNIKDVETTVEELDDGPPPPAPAVMRVVKMNSPEWKYLLLGTLGAAMAGVAMPVMSIFFAKLMKVYGEPCDVMRDRIAVLAPVFVYIGICSAMSEFCKAAFLGIAGEELTTRLRRLVFRAILRQEMAYFDNPRHSPGALTTRLATDASEVKGGVGARVGTIVHLSFALLSAICISLYYDWEMTLVSISFLPMVVISGIVSAKSVTGLANKNKKLLEEAGKVAVEAVENIRTVAQLSTEDVFFRKYHACLEGPFKQAVWHTHIRGFFMGFTQAVILFSYAGSFRFGGWQVQHQSEKYTMEDVFIVFGAIVFSAMAMGDSMSYTPDYNKARLATARVFDLLDREPPIDSSSKEGLQPSVTGRIAFKNVKFCYPGRPDVTVLDGFSMAVEPGQTVALVGSSGCGKSTCVQLLERFYDTNEGTLFLEGCDIQDLNIMHLRSQLGLVSQEPVLFACSIRDNIAYGDNSRQVSQEEIEAAAAKANIHKFIASLPDGYNTVVGEKGTQLSGGQKQRVAIARALIRNPKILLLDEATSALDTESEKIVQAALDRAREGRTCIVIAHRLSTIHTADNIIVIQNGNVVEQGIHGDLMKQSGVYYQLNQGQVQSLV